MAIRLLSLLKELVSERIQNYLVEVSKNDPIPEINRKNKQLGIFLLGPPGSGKGTFVRNFVLPKQRNIKIFNSDELSDLRARHSDKKYRPGKDYVPGTSGLLKRKLAAYFQTGQNFVYDLTGNTPKLVEPMYEAAHEAGYDLIIVHLLIPKQEAVSRVKSRNQSMTQPEIKNLQYVEDSYDLSKLWKMIRQYQSTLDPENYYVVATVPGESPIFMKYDNGLYFRKGDRYVKR